MIFPYNRVREIQRRYQDGELPREEAKEQLAYLLELKDSNDMCAAANARGVPSYGPLLRLSDVCNTLRLWAEFAAANLPGDSEAKQAARYQLWEAWETISLAIEKSNFLARLLFSLEGVRTVPCPDHKGRWSGCFPSGNPCPCQTGGNVTGWLPLDPMFADRTYWDEEKKRYQRESGE